MTSLIIDSYYYTVSSMKDNDIGRRGGIIWKRSISMQVTPIETISKMLCVVKTDIKCAKLLLINIHTYARFGCHKL